MELNAGITFSGISPLSSSDSGNALLPSAYLGSEISGVSGRYSRFQEKCQTLPFRSQKIFPR